MRLFRYFLPKEERFFELFAKHSQTCVQGALALQDMLRGGEETPVFCQRVSQFEHDADNITREVLTAVRRTFACSVTFSVIVWSRTSSIEAAYWARKLGARSACVSSTSSSNPCQS